MDGEGDGGETGSHMLRGHEGHVDSVTWHPQATLSQDKGQLNLASCGRDGNVFLWGLDSETPLAHLPNVGARVTDLEFHPSGRLLALTVEDASWRLWEVEKGEEVRAVLAYAVAIPYQHPFLYPIMNIFYCCFCN